MRVVDRVNVRIVDVGDLDMRVVDIVNVRVVDVSLINASV